VPARARVLERFEIGGSYVSQGGRRELRTPAAHKLAIGDVALLGGEHVKQFSDALWRVVERRGDGVVMVEPARAEKVNPPPARHKTWESFERQRDRNRNEQEARIRRHLLERQELARRQAAE